MGLGFAIAMLGLLEMNSGDIVCRFPGDAPGQKTISIRLEPQPSLKDQPGLFRVNMDLDGKLKIRAAAQPLQKTEARDILVMGRAGAGTVLSIGLRDDGLAALNMRVPAADNTSQSSTRRGACRGTAHHFDRWLPH